jgi:PAS domain S-box-containing protein
MGLASRTNEGIHATTMQEALLETVVDLSDDAIVVCDQNWHITSWGAAAERLFGQPRGHAIGIPLATFFSIHLRDEVDTVMSLVTAGERIRHFETEILRPDGLPLPVSLSLCRLGVVETEVVIVVIARDLTEQHLAQATLAEVDARIEEGEALAHVGSWMWDVRTGAIQWSSEFHRIHGVDPLEFEGTLDSHLELVHPGDRVDVRHAMLEAVESGQLFDRIYRVIASNGGVTTVYVRARPTFDSAGRAIGLRGIGHEITDRRPASSTTSVVADQTSDLGHEVSADLGHLVPPVDH